MLSINIFTWILPKKIISEVNRENQYEDTVATTTTPSSFLFIIHNMHFVLNMDLLFNSLFIVDYI